MAEIDKTSIRALEINRNDDKVYVDNQAKKWRTGSKPKLKRRYFHDGNLLLSDRMMRAAGVPEEQMRAYYKALNEYIYRDGK